MTIKHVHIDDLITILDGFVRKGLLFKAKPDGCGTWTIELTGGY